MVRPNINTLWLFNIAMENSPFIDDFPIKTSIYKGFSMAMLNNQMVYQTNQIHLTPSHSYPIWSGKGKMPWQTLLKLHRSGRLMAALGIFASYSEGDNTTQQARNQRWPKNELQNPLP